MPQQTIQTEEQIDDEYMTEEEEAALEEEHRRKMSRLARGCLEMAALMLALAGMFLLLETKAHLSVLYVLPPYTLSLSCVAASFFSMMAGLFTLRKNTFAMLVMLMGGWMVLFVMAAIYLQEPETIYRMMPDETREIRITLVSTPISSSLYIEEPIRENLLSERWKFPVHGKNIPLDDLIVLKKTAEGEVHMLYEGRLWAVYDPEDSSWEDVLHHDEEEEDVETTGKSKKNH